MAQERTFLKTLGTGIVSTALVLGAFSLGGTFNQDNSAQFSQIGDRLNAGDAVVVANQNATVTAISDLQTDVGAIQDHLFEEDRWEATSEVLALEELEEDDFEELREWVVTEYNLSEDAEDVEDFSVSVRDTDFSSMDVDDQNGVVTFDLRVRFEDDSGDRVKKFVTATVVIEDGEVESLDFVEQ